MGTLTIRNLDDDLKQKLRERAARHGVSMEQEARNLLLKDVAVTKERDGGGNPRIRPTTATSGFRSEEIH
ncbi:MAG: plasmid stabilization protein [Mesorhizobium sp.]|nr:MAG: plasmid stabilization protein [Mesorhizobium sp.]